MKRRFLFIFFPFMNAENVVVQRKIFSEGPVIVSYTKSGVDYVHCVNKSAAYLGIHPDMPLIDAVNIQSECTITKRNSRDEKFLIKSFIKKLKKFSPWISTKKEKSLLLNITGCSHLFGGEEHLAKKIILEVKKMGFTSNVGIGSSPSAAILAAIFKNNYHKSIEKSHEVLPGNYLNHEAKVTRFNSKIRSNTVKYTREGCSPQILGEKAESFISALPVNILDLKNKELNELYFLGLKNISHLSKLRRYELLEYFGKDFLNKLDRTLGVRNEPISPLEEKYNPIYCKDFIQPVISKNRLVLELENIIKIALRRLGETDTLIKEIAVTFISSKLEKKEINLMLKTATKEVDFIISLLKIKVDSIQFFSDVRELNLSIKESKKNNPLQSDMKYFSMPLKGIKNINSNEKYAELISKISLRIGYNNIRKIYLKNTHIPEKVASIVPIDTKVSNRSWEKSRSTLRPIYLFSPKKIEVEKFKNSPLPKTCTLSGVKKHISAAFGPDTIAPEWWCQNSTWELHTRDYWTIELLEGEKFWIFELKNGKLSNQWYIHGNFC